jgi:hypothetical protein
MHLSQERERLGLPHGAEERAGSPAVHPLFFLIQDAVSAARRGPQEDGKKSNEDAKKQERKEASDRELFASPYVA